jgi:hypothetical protein
LRCFIKDWIPFGLLWMRLDRTSKLAFSVAENFVVWRREGTRGEGPGKAKERTLD